MIAVVQIGGHQYTITENMTIVTDHQNLEVGAKLTTEALLVSDEAGTKTQVGTPTVAGSQVILVVKSQFKDEKVRVFKMKSKKRYMRTYGFRAHKTELVVESIKA